MSVVLLMLGYVSSWLSFLGMLVFSTLMLTGELLEGWDVVAGLGIAGVGIWVLMELYVRMLVALNPEWDRAHQT